VNLMPEVIRHATVAREIARRLRENDARGEESALRELGAKVIEHLVEQNEILDRKLNGEPIPEGRRWT